MSFLCKASLQRDVLLCRLPIVSACAVCKTIPTCATCLSFDIASGLELITEPAVSPALPTSTAAAPPLLEVRSLTKTFGDLQANQNIDLAIYGGEVHAILGENGAGKSTLMKCLYGFYQPTSGEILLEGKPVRIDTPLAGRRLGIGMVFQNFTLIPAMTVAENVALFLPELGIVLQPKAIRARIAEVAARYGLEIDPGAHVADLAMGERQKVEILKILLAGARADL